MGAGTRCKQCLLSAATINNERNSIILTGEVKVLNGTNNEEIEDALVACKQCQQFHNDDQDHSKLCPDNIEPSPSRCPQ